MAGHAAESNAIALAARPSPGQTVTKLVTGLASGSGSTVGPDGGLYVTEGKTGGCSGSTRRAGHSVR